MKIRLIIPLLLAVALATGCGSSNGESTPTEVPATAEPTAAPAVEPTEAPVAEATATQVAVSALESPLVAADVDSPLPTPEPTSIPIEPFAFFRPINVGDTEVKGYGPAGLPVLLVNITVGGDLLAQSNIDEEGHVTFELEAPLESGHRIGLGLGDVTAFGFEFSDFQDSGFNSPQALLVPRVGFFYDTQMVVE